MKRAWCGKGITTRHHAGVGQAIILDKRPVAGQGVARRTVSGHTAHGSSARIRTRNLDIQNVIILN